MVSLGPLVRRLLGRRALQKADPFAGRTLSLGRPVAGVHVNEDTALTLSAVWACVRISRCFRFFPIMFRKKIYTNLEPIPADLDAWQVMCNEL